MTREHCSLFHPKTMSTSLQTWYLFPSSSQGRQFCFGTANPRILLADGSIPFCTRALGSSFFLSLPFSFYTCWSNPATPKWRPPEMNDLILLHTTTREFLPPVMHSWVNKTDTLKGSIIYKSWKQNFLIDTKKTWMPMHSGIAHNIPEGKAAFHQGIHRQTSVLRHRIVRFFKRQNKQLYQSCMNTKAASFSSVNFAFRKIEACSRGKWWAKYRTQPQQSTYGTVFTIPGLDKPSSPSRAYLTGNWETHRAKMVHRSHPPRQDRLRNPTGFHS